MTFAMTRDMMHLVMHMMKRECDGPVKAITVRIPKSDYEVLKDYSNAKGRSLNMIVSDAIARSVASLNRQRLLSEVEAFHKKYGLHPDSDAVFELREMRLNRANQLDRERGEGDRDDDLHRR